MQINPVAGGSSDCSRRNNVFKGLKRVFYQVPDLDEAKKWYGQFLGIDPLFDTPIMVIFPIEGISLGLIASKTPLKEDNGRVSAYWEVDDVDAALRRIIDLGGSLHTEPVNLMTIRTAKALDPFGNIIGLTGSVPGAKTKTVESQPSETAITVCYFRALAAQDKRSEIRGPDIYAELFLTEEWKKRLADSSFGENDLARLINRTLYGYFIARTAFMDHVLKEAIQNKTPQIVFLGAGYDTRPYRFCDRLGETKVFELDAPATQNRKREILLQQSVPMPPHLSFVPINFNTDDLNMALAKAGFSPNQKSLFIWEGVMYYLGEAEVDRVLDALRNNSLPGGRLCFDYLAEKIQATNTGEPVKFWIEKTKIPSYLASRGFAVLDHVDMEEMTKRYLMLQDGTPAEKPLSRMHFVLAERQEP
jgi:methyltransferase (TIGR00027 family)